MKKLVVLFMAFVLLFTNSVAAATKTDGKTAPIEEKEFLKMVKKNEFYKQYKKDFFSNEYLVLNPVTNENGEQYGWIVQYELKYNEKKATQNDPSVVNFRSVITFIYDYEKGEFHSILLDYNRLLEEKAFFIIDLTGQTGEERIDVSDDPLFTDFLGDVKENKKEAEIEAQQDLQKDTEIGTLAAGQVCWQCSKTQTYGGDYSAKCTALVGSVCYVAGVHWAVRLLCAASTVIGCYVPKYTICVEGKWMTVCPV